MGVPKKRIKKNNRAQKAKRAEKQRRWAQARERADDRRRAMLADPIGALLAMTTIARKVRGR